MVTDILGFFILDGVVHPGEGEAEPILDDSSSYQL